MEGKKIVEMAGWVGLVGLVGPAGWFSFIYLFLPFFCFLL
jgi:hypothetical protein